MTFGRMWIFHPKIQRQKDDIWINVDFSSKNTALEGWDSNEYGFLT